MSNKHQIKTIQSISADYLNLDQVRSFINDEAKLFGFDDDNAYLISLAVDEACTNLIRYAYKFDKNKSIDISLESSGKKFVVIIQDNGLPFNPLNVPPPDMKEYFDEFKRGGLGIFIIRKAMDEVIYIPAEKPALKNELRLIKKLA